MMTKKKTLLGKKFGFAFFALVLSASMMLGVLITASVSPASAADTAYTQQELYAEGYKLSVELEEEGAVLFRTRTAPFPWRRIRRSTFTAI